MWHSMTSNWSFVEFKTIKKRSIRKTLRCIVKTDKHAYLNINNIYSYRYCTPKNFGGLTVLKFKVLCTIYILLSYVSVVIYCIHNKEATGLSMLCLC